MSAEKLVFVGILASAKSLKNLSVNTGYLAVENGKVRFFVYFLSK